MARPKSPTDNQVKTLAIEQRHRTIRTFVIGGWITASIWIITNGVVKLMDKPPWVAGLTVLVGALGAGAIQTPLFIRVRRFIKAWTRRNLDRVSRLESSRNPSRSTSGMNEDGTEPHEP